MRVFGQLRYFANLLLLFQFSSQNSVDLHQTPNGLPNIQKERTTLGQLIEKEQKRQTLGQLIAGESDGLPFEKGNSIAELIEIERIGGGQLAQFMEEISENEQLINKVFKQPRQNAQRTHNEQKGIIKKVIRMFSKKKDRKKGEEEKQLEEKYQNLKQIKETDPAMVQIMEKLQFHIKEIKSEPKSKSNKAKEERMLRLLVTAVDKLNGTINLSVEVDEIKRRRRRKRITQMLILIIGYCVITLIVSFVYLTVNFTNCVPTSDALKAKFLRRNISKALKRIPTENIMETGEEECAICLHSFEKEQKIRPIPPCQHKFHTECIDKWVKEHNNCPICRSMTFKISRLRRVRPNYQPLQQHEREGEGLEQIDQLGRQEGHHHYHQVEQHEEQQHLGQHDEQEHENQEHFEQQEGRQQYQAEHKEEQYAHGQKVEQHGEIGQPEEQHRQIEQQQTQDGRHVKQPEEHTQGDQDEQRQGEPEKVEQQQTGQQTGEQQQQQIEEHQQKEEEEEDGQRKESSEHGQQQREQEEEEEQNKRRQGTEGGHAGGKQSEQHGQKQGKVGEQKGEEEEEEE